MFKEDRFNGWLLGELFVLDTNLIANSRRDDFEKNQAYYDLLEVFKEWSISQSKIIRKISYDRSLSHEKKIVVEAENIDDINGLCTEDIYYGEEYGESDFINQGESDEIAESDYIGKLADFINQKKYQTKYMALNINKNMTGEQKKVLERVFDLIQSKYSEVESNQFINYISRNF